MLCNGDSDLNCYSLMALLQPDKYCVGCVSYINRIIATNVDLNYLAINQQHITYMLCGTQCAQTIDIGINSMTLSRHCHK